VSNYFQNQNITGDSTGSRKGLLPRQSLFSGNIKPVAHKIYPRTCARVLHYQATAYKGREYALRGLFVALMNN